MIENITAQQLAVIRTTNAMVVDSGLYDRYLQTVDSFGNMPEKEGSFLFGAQQHTVGSYCVYLMKARFGEIDEIPTSRAIIGYNGAMKADGTQLPDDIAGGIFNFEDLMFGYNRLRAQMAVRLMLLDCPETGDMIVGFPDSRDEAQPPAQTENPFVLAKRRW